MSNIKEYRGHLHSFCLYLEINIEECKKQMKVFFQELPETGSKINSDIKIDAWFDGSQKPQFSGKFKQIDKINLFFKALAKSKNKEWKEQWLTASMEELEVEKLLYGAIRKYRQPYAIARFHKDYAKDLGLLNNVIKKYCHQYFFIYRINSSDKLLVRDVLVIHGHQEEKIFCNLYQYTEHYIEKPKYPEWHNIERYNGNVIFNYSSLNMFFASPDFDIEHGADYLQLIMPRMKARKEILGLMMSLTDEDYNPIAAAILIQKTGLKKHYLRSKL